MDLGSQGDNVRRLLAVLLLAAPCAAMAQVEPWQEYDKLIKSAQAVKSDGPQLFGDSVNLYTGATSFSATDVSLPGNDTLPVALGRQYSHRGGGYITNRPFGDWDWDIPYISGVFSHEKGWILSDSAGYPSVNRCSAPLLGGSAAPPLVPIQADTPGFGFPIDAEEYWNGYQLQVSGGVQEILLVTGDTKPKPTDGKAYPWVTKDLWYLSCLSGLQSGQSGEGFLAQAPDGTKYRFDWMVSRPNDSLLKPYFTNGMLTDRPVDRDEIRIYPTRVEDRFGNWVEYRWDGSRLTSIVASDGRQLNFTWESYQLFNQNWRVKKVATASAPVREWSYDYDQYGYLTSVLLPDQSRWSISFQNISGESAYEETEEYLADGRKVKSLDKALSCSWMRTLAPIPRPASIRHPSGALAEFEFQAIRHGRNFVVSDCITTPQIGGELPSYEPEDKYFSRVPARFDVLALRSKRISGPGLPLHTWTYEYVTPTGGWSFQCPNCASTKTTTVKGPGGEKSISTFGVVFNENEGQLLKVEVFSGDRLLRSTVSTYLSNAAASSQQVFADRIGISPQSRLDSFSSERQRPLVARSIVQDGVTFSTTISEFDPFAKPQVATKVSSLGYSKTEAFEYSNDQSRWIIGQVKRVVSTDTGRVVAQIDYDPATALPAKTYSFGKSLQSFTYRADGTISSVADGRNLSTSLSAWKRGVPQEIRYHDGSVESASVDGAGWIRSASDANGYTTSYEYDSMGRQTKIHYPSGDSNAWLDTVVSFEPVPSAEYGLAAGHWRRTVTTGNRRATSYFDAFWRPVIEREEDLTDPQMTTRWSVKRYDHQGRIVFDSYPRNPFVDGVANFDSEVPGTATSYDVLGRVTEVSQDSELGPLRTVTEYLPGMMQKVTNPRGFATTTRYQAYDAPSYELPVELMQPLGVSVLIRRDVFGKPLEIQRNGPP
jgi:YD repeat-containing protein